jgi:cellobiose phosphorylase
MLYGFRGFRPTADGFVFEPRLPKDWPKLSVTRIRLHQGVLHLTAQADGVIQVRGEGYGDEPLAVQAPEGAQVATSGVKIVRAGAGP